MSAKWGMFGKSFNEIGQAIKGRINDVNKALTETNDLSASLKDTPSILARLFPSKESIQSQLIDVDRFYPEIDLKNFDFDKWINELNKVDKRVKANTTSWQDYSNSLKDNEKWIAEWGEKTEGQIRTQKQMIAANKQARQSAIDYNIALKQQTLSAKAAAFGIKAIETVMNTLAMAVITTAIITALQTIITKITEVVNAYEDGIKKIKDLSSEIKGLENDQASLNSEIEETEHRIYELNQIKMPNLFEQAELDNLKEYNEELRTQLKLKKLELELKKQEANQTAKDTFKSSQADFNPFDDFFNEDMEWWERIASIATIPLGGGGYSVWRNNLQNLTNWFQGNTWGQQMDYLTQAEDLVKKYGETAEKVKGITDTTEQQKVIEEQENLKNQIEEYNNNLKKRYNEWQIELLSLDPNDGDNTERIKQLQEAITRFEEVLSYDAPVYNNIQDLFDDVQFADITTQLKELAKAGKLNEEAFNKIEGIEKFKEALQNVGEEGISVSGVIAALNDKTQKELKETAEDVKNLSEAFDKLYDSIDNVLKKQEKLAEAFKKLQAGGKLTAKEIYELIKEMPSLAEYVIKDDDGYNISDEGFEAIIAENNNDIKEQITNNLEIARENIKLLEEEKQLKAEKDRIEAELANPENLDVNERKSLENQYDKIISQYEVVSNKTQNITNSIEDLKEKEQSLILVNDLLNESFDEEALMLEGINEAFKGIKSEVSTYNSNIQTIDNAIKTLKDGGLLTYDVMNALVDLAPELQDSFEEQENGYFIVIDALEKLRKQSYETRNSYIDDKIAEVKAEIESAETAKKAIEEQIKALSKLGETSAAVSAINIGLTSAFESTISNIDEKLKPLYDVIEKLEGLKGSLTDDSSGTSKISNELQNQIDYYKTILSAVEAVQNKYTDAIDKEINALNDSKEALKDNNDERQRELDLIEARNNLENAKKRKIWVYSEGEGFKQVADEKAVKEAEEKYQSVITDIQEAEIDKQIDALENAKETLEENTNALLNLENDIQDAKIIAQALSALGLTDESELIDLPPETIEEIKEALADAINKKDDEDNKENSQYIPISLDDILSGMGAKVNVEDAFKIISGIDSQKTAYENAIKEFTDSLKEYTNNAVSNITNNGGTNVINNNTFEIYDASDPQRVAEVVKSEITDLFTKVNNSIK